MRPIIWCSVLILLLGLGHPAAARADEKLEDLQYRVDLGIWHDVARVHLSFSQVGPDRYRAEFTGAAQGAWKLLSRWLPERYQTDMVLEQGRLKPLVYCEEFQYKGRHIHKEYRFDYSGGVLEVWRGVDHQELRKDSQVPLPEPVYDPLSLFYNLRLGALGVLRPGQTLRVAVVPTSEPREMVLRFGPEIAEGRKVMLEVKDKGSGAAEGPYFILSTPKGVPQQAWTRVFVGRLSGELLNPGEVMEAGLPLLTRLSFHSKPTPAQNKVRCQ